MPTFALPPNLFNLSPQNLRTILPLISLLTNIPLPPTGTIGVFSQATVAGVVRILRIGQARPGNGGVRFTFKAPPEDVAEYQVIFTGDKAATGAVNYYILRH